MHADKFPVSNLGCMTSNWGGLAYGIVAAHGLKVNSGHSISFIGLNICYHAMAGALDWVQLSDAC